MRNHLPIVYIATGAVVQFVGYLVLTGWINAIGAGGGPYPSPAGLYLGIAIAMVGFAVFLVGIIGQGVRIGTPTNWASKV